MSFRVVLDANAWRDYEQVQAYLIENELAYLLPEFDADLTSTLHFIEENPLLRSEARPDVRHEALRVFKHHHVWFRVIKDIDHVEASASSTTSAARKPSRNGSDSQNLRAGIAVTGGAAWVPILPVPLSLKASTSQKTLEGHGLRLVSTDDYR